MEDGVALGLVMNGATNASQVPARLALFEQIRRNHVSAIQVLSNFGFEEKIDEDMVKYMEGKPIPSELHLFLPQSRAEHLHFTRRGPPRVTKTKTKQP